MPTTNERIITLRARPATGLTVGMLLGSPKGRAIYRVLGITTLRRSGEVCPTPRLRVVCRRLTVDEAPAAGEAVHPWPSDPRAPRRPRPAPPARRPPANMVIQIATNRRADRLALELRRLGWREGAGFGTDVGPRLRHRAVVDAAGKVIREADVTIETARDLKRPQHQIRRAVRTDPLLRLKSSGSISLREFDAAEILRDLLEAMTQSGGQGEGGMPVHTAAFLRKPITGANIDACNDVREATDALGKHWEPVLWVCLGGTVDGYSSYRTMRLETAGGMVRDGMRKLADHFEGGKVCTP